MPDQVPKDSEAEKLLSAFGRALSKANAELVRTRASDPYLSTQPIAYHIPKLEAEIHTSVRLTSGGLRAVFQGSSTSESATTLRLEVVAIPADVALRILKLTQPPMHGDDVKHLQTLLQNVFRKQIQPFTNQQTFLDHALAWLRLNSPGSVPASEPQANMRKTLTDSTFINGLYDPFTAAYVAAFQTMAPNFPASGASGVLDLPTLAHLRILAER